MDQSYQQAILGCLLGTAVGDAIGLPLERLTPQRARKLFGEITPDYSMHLCLGRGLVSDDAEHAALTLQAYTDAKGDSEVFRRQLARRLKTWFLAFPPGIGAATVKACLKLLAGTPPQRSGVYSAGNGPAMRAPILGAVVENKEQLRAFVATSTHITHTDPKAEYGSLAVAYAAHCARTRQEIAPHDFLTGFRELLQADAGKQSAQELFQLLERVVESVEKGQTTPEFAVELGLPYGVSGYIYHTVPACLHAWLSHQNDYTKAIIAILQCGGDADSTAAIVGGIVGARVGKEGIPSHWRNAISEWPRSMKWMEKVALQAAESQPVRTPFWFFPVTALRNLFLLIIVLIHAVRRILPPY